MRESHEDILRRAHRELIDGGDLDVIETYFTPDYAAHSGSKTHRGHAFVRRFVRGLRASIPDVRTVEIVVLARAGDTLAWQRRLRGTHAADMRGIPASGRKVSWTEMVVSRFEGERIAEDWVVSELAGELFAKLG